MSMNEVVKMDFYPCEDGNVGRVADGKTRLDSAIIGMNSCGFGTWRRIR